VSDDAQLIAETLAGHTAAFGKLVLEYQDRLYNTVVHVAGNVEDARDIVQETFAQAFLKLDTFKGHSAFYTWIYRIALNLAAGHRRKRKPMGSIEHNREQFGMDPVDNCNGPLDQLDQEDRCRQVRHAMAQLSEEHRTVLVLREIEGCDYETIAGILDLPIGTVRSRIHRARIELRDQLKEVLIDEEWIVDSG